MKSSTLYDTTNPLVNNEDIEDHIGIGTVIHKGNEILLFFHKKYEFWTIPIGKVSFHSGYSPAVGMMKEVKEELGLTVLKFDCLGCFKKTYNRGGSINTNIECWLYDVLDYSGVIENKEPIKHPIMKWVNENQIPIIFKNTELSDLTRFYLLLKTQILDAKPVKLINEKI